MKEIDHKEYRDGFFRDLLGLDKGANRRFVDVANAAFNLGIGYDSEIIDVSLDNVFYTRLRNDVAKVVNGTLIVLVEHQSTVNENMPLRMLEYVSQTYLNLLDAKDRYKSRLQKIPRPFFAVFYNGKADFPQEKVLHLSDAFMGDGAAMMELDVPVININLSKGGGILMRSSVLYDYATLCKNIEECQRRGESDYIRAGILQTINSGVLVEYLQNNIQEAAGMLKAEYNYDMDMAVKAEESFELGMSKGMSKGMAQGRAEGFLSTAKAMLMRHIDCNMVADCTGLSLEEVAKLQAAL